MFCPKQFKSISALNRHIRVHTGSRPFRCYFCNDRFKEEGSLIKHIKTQHEPQRNICIICSEKFIKKSDLNLHMNIHHTGTERLHSCIFCGFKVHDMHQLKRHILVHTGTRPFTCSKCGDRFNQKANLKRHHMVKHTGLKPFLCHICGKSFGMSGNLKRHLHIHEEKEQRELNNVTLEKDICSPTTTSEIMDYSHDRAEINLDEHGTDSTHVTPEINLDYSDEENSDLQSDECDTDLFL